jgi:anhydro-N-acetylmuramic acid kinase
MSNSNTYHVIGLMSGTSLDGLDIAYCVFDLEHAKWTYQIKEACTVSYPDDLSKRLVESTKLSGLQLSLLDIELGSWMGAATNTFIKKHNISADLISSHGHTVFHQPEKGLTLQIGSGYELLNGCGVTVINDFRSKDVSLGGNGAPLVPIGDQLLFGQYAGCLNLGGIANISSRDKEEMTAYDIVPVNMILNNLAQQVGQVYDQNGDLARTGVVNEKLLKQLNSLPYYQLQSPKSLGYEWVVNNINPLLSAANLSVADQLATCIAHIAFQLAKHLPQGQTLVTGGGAYNAFLIECLKASVQQSQKLIFPDVRIIEFKEALIFAFLGVLKSRNEVNCLKSVTGALEDNIGGIIYSK